MQEDIQTVKQKDIQTVKQKDPKTQKTGAAPRFPAPGHAVKTAEALDIVECRETIPTVFLPNTYLRDEIKKLLL
jgi:hypothetical protein